MCARCTPYPCRHRSCCTAGLWSDEAAHTCSHGSADVGSRMTLWLSAILRIHGWLRCFRQAAPESFCHNTAHMSKKLHAPAATRPLMWAMSDSRMALWLSAILRMRGSRSAGCRLRPRHQQLGAVQLRVGFHHVVVDDAGLLIQAVGEGLHSTRLHELGQNCIMCNLCRGGGVEHSLQACVTWLCLRRLAAYLVQLVMAWSACVHE